MSAKNIKITAVCLFILFSLGGIYLYVQEKMSLFTKNLANETQPEFTHEDVTPLFYSFETKAVHKYKTKKQTQRNLFTLELGLTASKSVAESKIKEFKKKQIEAYYSPLSQKGMTYYRIRFGLFNSEQEAIRSQKLISTRGLKSKVRSLK